MENLGSFANFTFIGEDRIASSVDYQVCPTCGFRLMRIETTRINDQRIVATHCPICEHPNSPTTTGSVTLLDAELQKKFDAWLATHGLDRALLSDHYHLGIENFFDDVG